MRESIEQEQQPEEKRTQNKTITNSNISGPHLFYGTIPSKIDIL